MHASKLNHTAIIRETTIVDLRALVAAVFVSKIAQSSAETYSTASLVSEQSEHSRMKQCWASVLGDCGDEISKEHLVSAALWETRTINAKGFPWCRDEMKSFGINSLVSKILCKHHNNALSPLDTAAGIAFDALRRSAQIGNERQASSSTDWPVVELVKLASDDELRAWLLAAEPRAR